MVIALAEAQRPSISDLPARPAALGIIMANTLSKPEKYVDFANKCLWLANQSDDETVQTALRQMAREWIDLAEAALQVGSRQQK